MRQGLVAGGAALVAAFGLGILLTLLQWGIDPGRQTADIVVGTPASVEAHTVVADPGLKEAPRVLR